MFIDFGGEGIVFEQTATLQLQKVTGSQDGRGKGKREHGRHSGEHGRHSEGDEYIGPSLRAIKPWVWETLFRRSLRMTKGGGYRLAQTATLQLQKVTSSQDDRGKEKREHGRHSEGDEYIGPSLRAIKPWVWETLFRRSLRMTKG